MIKQAFKPGNCNIYAEWKILLVNETKQYEIWQGPKGWIQKIFQLLLPNFIKGCNKSWFRHFALKLNPLILPMSSMCLFEMSFGQKIIDQEPVYKTLGTCNVLNMDRLQGNLLSLIL